MTLHVQAISEKFSESSAPVWYYLDQKTLNTLVALLSHSLQAAVARDDFDSDDTEGALESDSREEHIKNATASSDGCSPETSSGVYVKRGRSISARQAVQLVADILEAASDLMLVRENKHGLMQIYSAYMSPPFI